MPIQRIDHAMSHTTGWQARVYTHYPKYLSAFFADKRYGPRRAKKLASEALAKLEAEAAKARKGGAAEMANRRSKP